MASLPSILILGTDTVAAAHPATPVQLVHACRAWGFTSVIPASWGDELIAANVIRRCESREGRSLVQCSCPKVADLLARHADLLGDVVLWMVSPPVAVARYLRAIENRDIHLTYAGGCPGAFDTSIDQRVAPDELLAALAARGIDLLGQPTVFNDIIPADRRRFYSSPAGIPDQHLLWESSQFRLTIPEGGDLTASVAQALLDDDASLIDLSSRVGCACRSSMETRTTDLVSLQRAPSPVIVAGSIDLSRAAPIIRTEQRPATAPPPQPPPVVDVGPTPGRPSQNRPAYRRQSTWRRQSPRPGMIIARPSAVLTVVSERRSFINRPPARVIATAVLVAAALFAFWIGRKTAPTDVSRPASPARPERSRVP